MSKPGSAAYDAPILLTMGEPAGIGPEIAVAAYKALGGMAGSHPLFFVGAQTVFESFGIDLLGKIGETNARATRVPGKPDPRNAAAVIEAIEISVDLCMRGIAAAMVTAPINKAVLMQSGFKFPGHTEFLAHLTGAPHPVMMLASEMLRASMPLTIHMPVSGGAARGHHRGDRRAGHDHPRSPQARFRHRAAEARGGRPQLPHPGEFGGEDGRIITPAVEALRARGHVVRGPLPAEGTLFHEEARKGPTRPRCACITTRR